MKKLSIDKLENVNGGSFCTGFAVVAAGYAIGLAFQLWNPIGWGGTAALAVVGGYCAIKDL